MKYALLIYEPEESFGSRTGSPDAELMTAWRAYYKALLDAGIYVGGDPLDAPSTGATVRIRDGRPQVQDGPYADTKEQLGGQIVLELPSLDAALVWAARCPTAAGGAIEVRPLSDRVRELVACEHG
jgi:hypothetical protein